jgi:hypothetical protein
MVRTQIYLTKAIDETLDHLSRDTGHSKSQLIRAALERAYLAGGNRDELRAALRVSAGKWRRRESGQSYVERIRQGRLARLHTAD